MVLEFSIDSVPRDFNVISSHVIDKVKVFDDNLLKVKALHAPKVNEDRLELYLKT